MQKSVICGVDEAGRGPLAGDVFAAAAILPDNFSLPQNLILTDSKKLSAKKREILFEYITKHCIYSIASASIEEIDKLNILQASLLAMSRAIQEISHKATIDIIKVDGNQIPKFNLDIACQSIVKGDLLVPAISAASILAKVARDKYMLDMHESYPNYAFNQHMGYPTKLHLQKIEQYGICKIHRKSFAPIRKMLNIECYIKG